MNWRRIAIAGLVVGMALAAQAEHLSDAQRKAIEERFPGAEITEIEEEEWEGRTVTEVELTTADGIDCEVYLSQDGEIVKVEEEDDGWHRKLFRGRRRERQTAEGADSTTEQSTQTEER